MSKRMNGKTPLSDKGLERAVSRLQRAPGEPAGAIPGYAAGTLSAPPEPAGAGESGPELVEFSSGERGYTAARSAAPAGAAGSGGSAQVISHDTIDASNLAQINRLAERMAGARMSMRMGYAGGR